MSEFQEMFKDSVSPDIYFWPLLCRTPYGNAHLQNHPPLRHLRKNLPKGLHDIAQAAVRKSSNPI